MKVLQIVHSLLKKRISPQITFKRLSNDLLEGIVEKSVQERISDWGEHPGEKGECVTHRDDHTSLRKYLRTEIKSNNDVFYSSYKLDRFEEILVFIKLLVLVVL